MSQPGSAREAGNAFLRDLDAEGWQTLFQYTEPYPFRPGDVIVRMGDTDRSFCIVTEGQLEVIIPISASGDREEGSRRIALIDEGSIFGEQSLLDGRPRSADIRAVTAGRLRVMSLRRLEQLAHAHPSLGHRVLLDLGRIVSERLRNTTTVMNALYAARPEGTRED